MNTIDLPFKKVQSLKFTLMMFLSIGIAGFLLMGGVLLGANSVIHSSNNTNNPNTELLASHNSIAKGVAAPVISAVAVTEITNSTAMIRWETNKAADGQVDYGTSEVYEFSSALETRSDTKHEIFLINLEPGLTYHFQVRSKDPVGNLAVSGDFTFTTLAAQRGQASVCGWDGDSLERVDTFCLSQDGWAKGESWTEDCSMVWSNTSSLPVSDCVYQFSEVKAQKSSVGLNESWQVTLNPTYTGWVDILIVESPEGTDKFLPAAAWAQEGKLTMEGMGSAGKYSFRFRPADDSAAWSSLLTITIRK